MEGRGWGRRKRGGGDEGDEGDEGSRLSVYKDDIISKNEE